MPDLDLLRGTLDLLILKALTWGPRHGYAVTSWIRDTTAGDLEVEDGALYQALHRLERRGWLAAEWGVSENNRKAKYYSLTEHLIIPEILVFSRRTWEELSEEDQELIMRLAKEAQQEQRVLWDERVEASMQKIKEAGIEVITFEDKTPFQEAVKPVWDKYGANYAELVERIQAVE